VGKRTRRRNSFGISPVYGRNRQSDELFWRKSGTLHDMPDEPRIRIDAKTFQEPVWKLAETMAQKVRREGAAYLRGPEHIADDIFVMMRQAIATYNLLFYLNADDRRDNDPYWNNSYGVVSAPLVRSMIDCLYNITAILQDPETKGPAYRKAGLKKRLGDIEEDRATYDGKANWDEYNAVQLSALDVLIRGSGYTEQEIRAAKSWPTLGMYLQGNPASFTPHQRFIKTFTHLQWRQYSALAHCGYEGYIGELTPGAYLMIDCLPHDIRPKVNAQYVDFLTRHTGRAATVLLCISTEIQGYFSFDGANINNRIREMWGALTNLFEAKELYDEHYSAIMKAKGIEAGSSK
jgi:hypothetical protein